ncbi:hypothetical protein ZWY2020_048499 [Hordeum vulgare]|nr:hypothetical protein ZWY2020_048499 [Hordeum vulgare]
MARNPCDIRILLVAAAVAFIYIQVRLFSTQSSNSHDAGRLAEAEKCESQLHAMIDQVSAQQEKIAALEEMKVRQDEERVQLKILIQDLEKRSLQTLIDKNVVPVAAVVIMACNRPDYLQRTVESILKYQKAVASKFPLFISQDGTNGEVKKKALSYNQITFMQVQRTERPGENAVYYKIANHYKWALDELFIKHDFRRVIILEDDMEIAPDFFDYFEAAAKLLDSDKIKHGTIHQYLKPILNDAYIDWNSRPELPQGGRCSTAAYKGVVVFRYKSSRRRIYLVGPDSLRQLGV